MLRPGSRGVVCESGPGGPGGHVLEAAAALLAVDAAGRLRLRPEVVPAARIGPGESSRSGGASLGLAAGS